MPSCSKHVCQRFFERGKYPLLLSMSLAVLWSQESAGMLIATKEDATKSDIATGKKNAKKSEKQGAGAAGKEKSQSAGGSAATGEKANSAKAGSDAKNTSEKAQESEAADNAPLSVIGLNKTEARLINQGKWREASAALEKIVARKRGPSRDHAWLAFAYLFLGKSDELKKMAQDLEKADKSNNYTTLVKAFDMTYEGKFEEAEKTLLCLPPAFGGDPLANFALALVTAKQGKASAAAAYCANSVELDPQFAWGYRTLGYLQQRWLEDVPSAERSYARALEIEPTMVEAQDALVDLRLSRNDFDGAIDAAENAIKADKKSANNYSRLAQIYTEQWRLREALDLLKKAIALEPSNPRFYRGQAAIKSFQGRLNDAIVDQQKAVELSKDKAFELVELANMNVLAGNNNKAADNLKEALKLEPDNQAAHDKLVRLLSQEKRYDDLIEECKRTVTRKPKEAKYRMELAQAYVLASKPDLAIDEYKEAGNIAPNDPEPHRRLGALYVSKKQWTAAAKEYTLALNINPTSVSDIVALGYCYAQEDDYIKAEAAFVTALALHQLSPQSQPGGPGKIDIMRSLAALLLDEGRYADAAGQFDAVLLSTHSPFDSFMLAQARALRDLSKSSAEGLLEAFKKLPEEDRIKQRLALADTLVKSGKADLALPILDEIEKQGNKDANFESQFWVVKARASLLKGDLVKAQEFAGKATTIEGPSYPQKSEALVALADVQLAKKDTDGAEQSATKAIEANTKSYAGFVLLGRIALAKSDYKKAINWAEEALKLNPYNANAYIVKGDAQTALGDVKGATTSYRKAVEFYPALLDAHKALLQSLRKQSLKDEVKKEEEQIAQLETTK